MIDFIMLWINALNKNPENWMGIMFWGAFVYGAIFIFTYNTQYEKIVNKYKYTASLFGIILTLLYPFVHIIILIGITYFGAEFISKLKKEWNYD